jgi:glycosyltransferase involved in cell wall biosynthesis
MIRLPYFSIVTPVFNRQVAVRRAIDSCLAQDFSSFEVVVVDDGSSDGTAHTISQYIDPRVRLIQHESNRGMWPARHSAIRAARGDWVIFLDSDDEMLPNCLSRVHQYVAVAGDEVDRFGFQYLYDDGRVSPLPPEPIVAYTEWLRWIEQSPMTDSLWVMRRSCFIRCPLPECFEPEFSYGLDFARHFKTQMVAEVLALVHTDCPDRLSYRIPSTDREIVKRKARDRAGEWQYVLAEHGASLRRLAPRQYEAVLRNAAISNLLAGERGRAVQASFTALHFRLESLYAWVTLLLVLAGPGAAILLSRIRSESFRRSRTASASFPNPARLSQIPSESINRS